MKLRVMLLLSPTNKKSWLRIDEETAGSLLVIRTALEVVLSPGQHGSPSSGGSDAASDSDGSKVVVPFLRWVRVIVGRKVVRIFMG